MKVKPIGYSVYPNIMFAVEGGNTEKYFDIVTHESSGNRGRILSIDCYNIYYNMVMEVYKNTKIVNFHYTFAGALRLLKPIIGPKVITLRLRMDNRNSYGTTISVHNAFIKIHVSDLNF